VNAPKHTPGPWTVWEEGGVYVDSPTYLVCSVYGPGPAVLANARLIAAAPELLEALKDVMERLVDRHEADESAVKARAAIAKATEGEA